MKLMYFDFECANGHQFEELVQPNVHDLECPLCRTLAVRQISASHIDWRRMGLDSGFPGAYSKWAKMQKEKASKEDSYNLVHY